jgi:hypothetical protein
MTSDTTRFVAIPGRDDLEPLLHAWRAAYPAMGVLMLLPEAERGRLAAWQQPFRDLAVPLVGAVFPALVAGDGFRQDGAWLLRFNRMPYARLHDDLPTDPEQLPAAADAIARGVLDDLGAARDATLLMVFDALVPRIGTLLDELYLRLANRVHYAGASAGSESFRPMPCLFDAERIRGGGVLAILLKSHHGAVLEHGYTAPAEILTATSTDGNRITEIDWRPAFEVYRDLVRARCGAELTRANFYRHAVQFPFAIVRANGAMLVRIPVTLEPDGSFFCVDEVPPHSVLTLMPQPAVDSERTVDTLVRGLAETDGAGTGRELLLFYCAGRRLQIGLDAAARELGEFSRRANAVQVAGALSLGEIGSVPGVAYPLLHNATLVATRWPGTDA